MNGSRITTDVDRALEVLRNGGLVAIPTETVYGLAADAADDTAIRRVFSVKRRPATHPLIVHIADEAHLRLWSVDVPASATVLARACWPGPLTVLVPRADHVHDTVTGGRDTVGLRVPAHEMTLSLLARFVGGLAAPSANRYGKVSPTTAEHVAADLGGDVDLILDGGPCPVGVESTIVDCTTDPPQLLRPGGVPAEHIEQLLDAGLSPARGPSRAAGMVVSHYAPRARVVLAADAAEARAIAATEPGAEVLDGGDDLVVYARTLYDSLRAADARGATVVVAVMPPAAGLGHAIRDRLTKAAAA